MYISRQAFGWLKMLRRDFKKYIGCVRNAGGVDLIRQRKMRADFTKIPFSSTVKRNGALFSLDLDVVFLKNFNNWSFFKKFIFLQTKPSFFTFSSVIWWVMMLVYYVM